MFNAILNSELLAGRPVIVQVHTKKVKVNSHFEVKIKSHFVVITGVNGSTYNINDPWDLEFTPRTLENGALGSYKIRALWLYHYTDNNFWPMFQNNLQHTGQSQFSGPQTYNLKWVFDSKNYSTYGTFFESQPAIDSEGKIYIGASCSGGNPSVYFTGIYAINTDGSLAWEYQTDDSVVATPAIGPDGTLYFGSVDHFFYALNSDGTLKWRINLGSNCVVSPTVGPDGTIYVGADKLYAINPNGSIKWVYEYHNYFVFATPVISSEGTIYIHTTGNDSRLIALNPDGIFKWEYNTLFHSSYSIFPVVGNDDSLYLPTHPNVLKVLNPDGTLKWQRSFEQPITAPAIGSNGDIYISEIFRLNSINLDGTLNWQYENTGYYPVPVIGADGTIYVFYNGSGHVEAINPDATLKWRSAEAFTGNTTSLAIGLDNTLLLGSQDGKLYVFGD